MYVPGANVKALEKCTTLMDLDGVILDLEDGSGAPELKAPARANVVGMLQRKAFSPHMKVMVRVNGVESPWFTADVEALSKAASDGGQVHGMCLPKVGKREDIVQLATALTDVGAPSSLELWAMIETAMGVLNAGQIASASSGGWDQPAVPLTCLVAGTTDLAAELRATHVQGQPHRQHLLAALSMIVLASRAYGLSCLDGVSLSLPNAGEVAEQLQAECLQGKGLGFDGKTLIHPAQITAANAAFGPSLTDIDRARRTVEAWSARPAEQGVAVLDGTLIEGMHVTNAERLLAMAESMAKRGQR